MSPVEKEGGEESWVLGEQKSESECRVARVIALFS